MQDGYNISQAKFDHVISGVSCPICNKPIGDACGSIASERFVHAGRMSVYYGEHRTERIQIINAA